MGERIRTIIVDDNEDALEIMYFYIEQLPDFQIVDKCRNGEELIDSVMRLGPDVVVLDINMPKLNGVEAIQSCLSIRNDLVFVFITGYDEYAVRAFELGALDYIMKPIEKTRFYSALEKVKKAIQKKEEDCTGCDQWKRLIIKDHHDIFYIPVQDIFFVEKVAKKCHIQTVEKEYRTTENIAELLQRLPENRFFLSHRSYIVNLARITHISVQNQTYLAFFPHTHKYAHVSKLKIDEMQERMGIIWRES